MKIYISGPITGVNNYMERFIRAEEILEKEGHIIVNPAKVNAGLPEGTTHEEYMQMSYCMMEMCEAAFFLKGWEHSKGCNLEMKKAIQDKMTTIFEGGQGCRNTQSY